MKPEEIEHGLKSDSLKMYSHQTYAKVLLLMSALSRHYKVVKDREIPNMVADVMKMDKNSAFLVILLSRYTEHMAPL